MRVGPFVVHVLDTVLGPIVLHADSGYLRPHPVRAAAGERLVRVRLTQDAPVEFRGDAVLMRLGCAAHHLAGGDPMRRQLGEPRTKARINVSLENLRGRIDVGIGIPGTPPGSHDRSAQRMRDTSPHSRPLQPQLAP